MKTLSMVAVLLLAVGGQVVAAEEPAPEHPERGVLAEQTLQAVAQNIADIRNRQETHGCGGGVYLNVTNVCPM